MHLNRKNHTDRSYHFAPRPFSASVDLQALLLMLTLDGLAGDSISEEKSLLVKEGE